ncbi:MAG: hypothetical protein OXE79_02010 [Acidimicrobiaceae bacterium]|nr:hypothetical protein [Acidimicrobiaceae bacterium]
MPATTMPALQQDRQQDGMRAAASVVGLVAALLLLAAACRVDTAVHVEVGDAGSGTVTVVVNADARAVESVGELAGELRFDDAVEAGWTVQDPLSDVAGGVQLRAVKRFESAGQLKQVLDEIAGPDAIFSNVDLRHDRSFAKSAYSFTADINPALPLETFSDDALAAVFGGQPFGQPLQDRIRETAERINEIVNLSDSLGFEFRLTLIDADDAFQASSQAASGASPDDSSVSSTDTGAGDVAAAATEVSRSTASWRFSYGDEPFSVSASTSIEDTEAPLWRNIAFVVGAAFGVIVLGLAVARLVMLMRGPKGHSRRAVRQRRERAAAREAQAELPRKRLLRLLVLDVHGVIVRPINPLEDLLVPVVTNENPDLDPDLVRDRHRLLVLGRITVEEFWSDLGLGPIARDVETRYLSSFKMVPGLHPFLDRVASRNLPVAAIGNQPREWGQRLRRMAQLEDSVSSWLVSGVVGAALPERSLFEATRRVISVDARDCLYLSSVPEYLDAAAEVGMATGYFAATPEDVQDTEHSLIRGFDDILKGRSTHN